ncbi:MAG: hypothetical protein Q9192_006983 [Flavoplaca navasiana]
MLQSLIDTHFLPRGMILVGFSMSVPVMAQMIVFYCAWEKRTKHREKCTKTAPEKGKRLKKENGPHPVGDGCGREGDSPPDYLEVDGELETPKDDGANIKELEAGVLQMVLGETLIHRVTSLNARMVGASARKIGGLRSTKGIA